MTTVLVVEDSAPLGRLLRQTLGRAGHECTWVPTAAAALDAVAAAAPEVVVLDLHLGDMDGAELAAALRAAATGVRIIGLSGETPTPEGMSQFDTFLLKPVALDVLLGSIAAP